MPSITRFAFGSAFRARPFFARATQLAIVGTIVLGACDKALAPTAVVDGGSVANSAVTPGTLSIPHSPTNPPPTTGLHHEVTYTGKVVLSVDGNGTNGSSGIIQVLKPAGATVIAAYVAAATTPSSRTLANGDVSINGTGVTFSEIVAGSFGTSNGWGDVTSIVKPIVDGAAAGLVDLTITEVNTFSLDGEVIAVVFSDPSQTRNNTVVLLFGAQNTAGDDFSIDLANPIDKTDAALKIDMSLGISFSFQPAGQYSTVDVNSTRMTSSAGGQDDGAGEDGALLTVGGIGDTNANPADPNQTDSGGPLYDDELYNILPFVANGDTHIAVHTVNPSNNDNIFFSAFFMNVAGNVNCESTPPTVNVTGMIAGPPKQIQITAQDGGSGMQSIVVTKSDNADTPVPPFVQGSTTPIVITATKINQSQSAVIGLTATDACGNSTIFDPLDVSLGEARGIQSLTETSRSVTASGISDVEHFVMIQNGNPGVKSVTVTVNGKRFEIANLKSGETRRDIDIGSAMTKGEPNTVQFRSKGKLGAGAIAVLYQ
jgi:hypothetical protein